jgi:hypothetical protein
MCWPRDRFPEQSPSTNELCGPRRGFVTRTNKWPRVSLSRTRISRPLVITRETTTKYFPHQTQPNVCPNNGSGLPVHPAQSGDQPAHLPLLPHSGVKGLPEGRIPKSDESFFLFLIVVQLSWTGKFMFSCKDWRQVVRWGGADKEKKREKKRNSPRDTRGV